MKRGVYLQFCSLGCQETTALKLPWYHYFLGDQIMPRFWLLCLMALLPGTLFWFTSPPRVYRLEAMAQEQSVKPSVANLTTEEQNNIHVYESVNRAVVHITTRSVADETFLRLETPTEGSGSGSVLDRQGHILTNFHVVEEATQIQVTLYDGQSYRAQLVGQDPANDIAVLRIEAPSERLNPVRLGNSSQLKIGQKIFAIGNPFGLERTLTVGIISSLNRTLPARNRRTMKSIIQIDAALNQGNSGGPLLDSSGQLVGMNTAIASRTGQNTGVGFAIPANTIKRVVPQLIRNGRIIRADIGITRVYQTEEGLMIARMTPGGPAEKAGLQGFRLLRRQNRRGPFVFEEARVDQSHADLIIAVDQRKIVTVEDFLTLIDQKKPGDQVTITVIRDRRKLDIPVILGSDS